MVLQAYTLSVLVQTSKMCTFRYIGSFDEIQCISVSMTAPTTLLDIQMHIFLNFVL